MEKRLLVRCLSARPYLKQAEDGRFVQGEFEGALIDLTVGKLYEASEGGRGYYRIVDDSGEDYLYPKSHFEVVGMTDLQ